MKDNVICFSRGLQDLVDELRGPTINGWRAGGVQEKSVYVLKTDKDLERVGDCWARGRLRIGDLVAPLEIAGDCFWKYQLLAGGEPVLRGSGGKRLFHAYHGIVFGSYVMGELYEHQPTEDEWDRMLLGAFVEFTRSS